MSASKAVLMSSDSKTQGSVTDNRGQQIADDSRHGSFCRMEHLHDQS